MWSRVKEAVSKNFAKTYQVKMGSILKTAAAFLQNQAFVWEKKGYLNKLNSFRKLLTLNGLKYPHLLNTSKLEPFKNY